MASQVSGQEKCGIFCWSVPTYWFIPFAAGLAQRQDRGWLFKFWTFLFFFLNDNNPLGGRHITAGPTGGTWPLFYLKFSGIQRKGEDGEGVCSETSRKRGNPVTVCAAIRRSRLRTGARAPSQAVADRRPTKNKKTRPLADYFSDTRICFFFINWTDNRPNWSVSMLKRMSMTWFKSAAWTSRNSNDRRIINSIDSLTFDSSWDKAVDSFFSSKNRWHSGGDPDCGSSSDVIRKGKTWCGRHFRIIQPRDHQLRRFSSPN